MPKFEIDPVCGQEVTVLGNVPTHEHEGKAYYFCSRECRDEFAAYPEDYLGVEEELDDEVEELDEE